MKFISSLAVVAILASVAISDGLAIVNGQIETDHEAVGAITDGAGTFATAVLIDPYWVLTSAAFADLADSGSFHVGLDYATPDAIHAISALFPHPSYDPGTGAYNIALVRLATPVAGVTPIPYLTLPSALYGGATVKYVGYGWSSLGDGSNTIRRSCSSVVEDLYMATFITIDGSAGPYLGDAGGPALLDFGGVPHVAGLVSLIPDGELTYTVATRVSTFVTFIESVMDANPPVSAVAETPPAGRLLPAAPNPFNPSTEISFVLDAPSSCRLVVFDPRGRKVADLRRGHFEAGSHAARWDGRGTGGSRVPSGVYFVVLQTDTSTETRKVVLAK